MANFQHMLEVIKNVRTLGINVEAKLPGEELSTGDYIPALLLNRLGDRQMIIKFVDFEFADEVIGDENPNKVYWADASGITMLKAPEAGVWGDPFTTMGLIVTNGPKLAKRLKEVVRLTRFWDTKALNIKWVEIPEGRPETDYDGINYISMTHAVNMARNIENKRSRYRFMTAVNTGKIVRVNYRHLFSDGLIKGDAIIISDEQMVRTHGLYDAVVPSINLKSEIRTDGWSFTTMNPHHAHNQAMFDVQSASWLREWLYPRALMKDTLTTVIDTALESLRNGEWPAWMILSEQDAHLDGNESLPRLERASEQFSRNYLKWQFYGMKPEQSASIMGMAANTFLSRLESKLNFRDHNGDWKPRLWFPLPHAVYGHIVTHEFLELGGFEIPEGCEDKLFYHEESNSFSIPGDEFFDTFEAHGTWDLDDSSKFFIRKVKTDATYRGVKYRAGELAGVIVRSPNSDGEYSIHKVGNVEGFPLYHQYGEIPEIDLTTAPRRIEEVMAGQKVRGLPANPVVRVGPFMESTAKESIDVQIENPGVGPVANAMMVYYGSKGKSPANVLDTMGNIVDCVQQTPYMAGFSAIKKFTVELWLEIYHHGKVDKFLSITRVPKKIMVDGEVRSLRRALNTYEGYFTNLFGHMKKETARFKESSRTIAFANRQANLISEIRDMEFTDDERKTASKWVTAYENNFVKVMEEFKGYDRLSKQKRAAAMRALISRMVTKLDAMDKDVRTRLVMAMYRNVTTPRIPNMKYGISDRCLFAPAPEGERSVMDVFLDALVDQGVAQVPEIAREMSYDEMMMMLITDI
jgi:hypothetical protein